MERLPEKISLLTIQTNFCHNEGIKECNSVGIAGETRKNSQVISFYDNHSLENIAKVEDVTQSSFKYDQTVGDAGCFWDVWQSRMEE